LVLVLILATLDIICIGISKKSAKIHEYVAKYCHILGKIPITCQILAKIKNIDIGIAGQYDGANILVSTQIFAGIIYWY
jgi:hypothetical protein